MSSSSSLSAYHEETIVAQITSLYTLLLKLSYFSPEGVEFPPAGANGHIINEELCRELHLVPEVISLMKKIPYTFDGYQKPLLGESRAFSYLDGQEIRNGRDPENTDTSGDLRMDFLKPWEIALTCWVQTDDGFSIILNTKSNIIQIIDASAENLNDFREESEAHHAPTYLQGIINDIYNLEHIYLPGGDIGIAHPESSEQVQIKRILIEDYGWGTEEFREEDWRREGEEICNRISDEAMEIWEEQKKKLMAEKPWKNVNGAYAQ
ncbi:hypothetical protein N7456_011284 [Penicillium angulare]|uniref:Uncharacterized protein n=1 Tax=Penicillium angulare TaxID=116970 RepID=A0A9W9ETG6_9EURO|nr:hypothetical protein N7456_011284 [Penicillium angulare]